MVAHIHQAGHLRFRWITCDQFFGRNTDFQDRLNGLGCGYFAEVPPGVGKGRRPSKVRLRAGEAAAELADRLPPEAWRPYLIGDDFEGDSIGNG